MNSRYIRQGYRRYGRYIRSIALPLLCLGTAALLITGCKNDNGINNPNPNPNPGGEADILEILAADADFETFSSLVEGTSLESLLAGNGPVTVFAPTETAFNRLPQGYLDGLSTQQKLDLLRYHLYNGLTAFTQQPVAETEVLTSLHGDPLFFRHSAGSTTVNGSSAVTERNIEAANGLIHAVDRLLLPDAFGTLYENIKKRFAYEGLLERIDAQGLRNILEGEGPLSFMAPHPMSLSRLEDDLNWELTDPQWTEILEYHVLNEDISVVGPGTRMALPSATGDSVYVTMPAPAELRVNFNEILNVVPASNGHLFELDGVMLPDKYVSVMTLMDKRFSLTTVRAAFAVAKLTGTLYDLDDEFTIFIPKNNAPGVTNLPGSESELADVLKYHVLPFRLTAAGLQDGAEYTTWHGEKISVAKSGGTVTINGSARIVVADLEGRNGVVHVIDRLLEMPVE